MTPIERTILENQYAMMRILRILLIHADAHKYNESAWSMLERFMEGTKELLEIEGNE